MVAPLIFSSINLKQTAHSFLANPSDCYQLLLRFADFRFKICLVVSVAVCGAQATEEGGWKLKTFGFLLLLCGGLLLPHHLTI